jgi:hypothetical protein
MMSAVGAANGDLISGAICSAQCLIPNTRHAPTASLALKIKLLPAENILRLVAVKNYLQCSALLRTVQYCFALSKRFADLHFK